MKYSIRGISHRIGINDVIGAIATCDKDYVFDGVELVTPLAIINGWANVKNIRTDTKYFCPKIGTRACHRSKREARLMKAQKWSRKVEHLFGDINDDLPF